MKQPLGVILAGGLATRMGGGDKGLLPLRGRCVIDFVLERLEPQVAEVALNANGDPGRWDRYDLPIIPDAKPDFSGPLAGVLAGMNWAAEQGADHIITVAADTPFFPQDLVPQLLLSAENENKPIALAATRDGGKLWRQPTFGLWPVSLQENLSDALDDGVRKVVQWTDQHGTALAEFPSTPVDPFFNINTPDDLAKAEVL